MQQHLLEAVGRADVGVGAPARTTMPMRESASSTREPAITLPCRIRSSSA
jgi:hypothetical protein